MCTRSHFLYCRWRRTGFNLGLISESGMCCPSYSLSPHFYHFEMYVDGPMGLRWGGSCDRYDYARWGFDEWSLSSSVLSARVKWTAIRNPISTFTVKVRHKFTCSPTHKMLLASTVVSCLSGATWGSRSCSRTLQHRWIKPRSSGFVDAPLYLLQRRLVFRITKAFFLRLLEDDLVDVHIRHLLFSCSQLDYFHCWDAETVSSWAFSLP